MVLGAVLLLTTVGVSGCAVAPDVSGGPGGQNLTENIIEILLYPMLIIQTTLGVSALAITISVTGEGRVRETQAALSKNPDGDPHPLRDRWMSVFHRLRPGLVFITVLRLVLIGWVLFDLAFSEGRSIALFADGTSVSVLTASLWLFLSFVASLLMPFTLVAFDAAAGVFLSVVLKKRLHSLMFQVVELVLRTAFVVGVTWLTLGFVAGSHSLESWQAWLTVFGFSAFADWGFTLLHLGFVDAVWGTIPYGIFMAAALLVLGIGQVILAELMLRSAAGILSSKWWTT